MIQTKTTAFCTPALFQHQPLLSVPITRRAPPCMILRSPGNADEKIYRQPIVRSYKSRSQENDTAHIQIPDHTETQLDGAASPPPIDGNGSSGSGGDNSDEDADNNDANPISPEILAVLERAHRDFSSLPPDVRSATAEQLQRLLVVETMPVIGALARVWPALRNRLVANKRLPIQIGVELTVGFVTKTLAELRGRGDKFWREFDFYLSDIALELVGDAMLVWLLSPTAVFASTARKSGIGAFLQSLPSHAGQAGQFSLFQRVSAFGYKGVQFALVGFFSSVVGHGLTTAMVKYRRKQALNRGEVVDNGVVLAPVLSTSLVWGGFMMASSNSRYQTVNSIEQRILDPVLGRNPLLLTLVTFGVRFGNCYVGGMHWLPWAKHFAIQ